MQRIRCSDCGKLYDYDEDAFCPHCGAFNQTPGSASAAVKDSPKEEADEGNAAHELFREALGRKGRFYADGGKSTSRTGAASDFPFTASGRAERKRKSAGGKLIFWIVLLIVAMNLLRMLFFRW